MLVQGLHHSIMLRVLRKLYSAVCTAITKTILREVEKATVTLKKYIDRFQDEKERLLLITLIRAETI